MTVPMKQPENYIQPTDLEDAALQDFLGQGPREDLGGNLDLSWPSVGLTHQPHQFYVLGDATAKEFIGQIVHVEARRSWWENPMTDDDDEGSGEGSSGEGASGNRPDCWSIGNVRPHGNATMPQGQSCASCPQSKFGSALKGEGQACKDMRWIWVIVHGQNMGSIPAVLTIPPTSLKMWSAYVTELKQKGAHRPHNCLTKFTLEKGVAGKHIYAKVRLSVEAPVSRDMLLAAIKMDQQIGEMSQQYDSGAYSERKAPAAAATPGTPTPGNAAQGAAEAATEAAPPANPEGTAEDTFGKDKTPF